MKINKLKRDPQIVEEGRWIKDIPEFGNLRLKVRGLQSIAVINHRAALERAVPRSERRADGSLPPEVGERILGQTLHEVVLLDWDNLEDDDDKPIKYDKATAELYCTDPWYRNFGDAVVWAAQAVDRGFQDEKKDLGKNSKRSSDGKPDGATTD